MKKIFYLRVALIAPLLALASLISAFTVLPVKAAPVSDTTVTVQSQR